MIFYEGAYFFLKPNYLPIRPKIWRRVLRLGGFEWQRLAHSSVGWLFGIVFVVFFTCYSYVVASLLGFGA
jgi:hypothetical protein